MKQLELQNCVVADCKCMYVTGNNIIKVWDVVAGGRLLASFSNHQKTITSLCFDGSYHRLLSAGLDRSVILILYV